jgi:hypothetical protein
VRSESCYEISFCETRKKQFSLQNFVERLAFRDSSYEIFVCETHEKRVSLLILTRESRENLGSKKPVSLLARISKSDSRVNPRYWTDLDAGVSVVNLQNPKDARVNFSSSFRHPWRLSIVHVCVCAHV